MSRSYQIAAKWDNEAGVWIAESDDVPGLVVEAATPNDLMAKLQILVPELLELNRALPDESGNLSFMVRYEHAENLVVSLASCVQLRARAEEILRDHGCRFERSGRGDREIWYSPITGRQFP
jgi:predicted RNase H-like HicB family nuclease